MVYIFFCIKFLGSLGLFLSGMKFLSDGIQRAAGSGLRHSLNMMTKSTPKAILTGAVVTALVQSSSATTVMVVSFVNAGLLTLVQAAGVIFGANVGTTITAWIVSLMGFGFNISSMALPMIGLGFILMNAVKRKSKLRDYGEAALGFGLLFLGLDFLAKIIPAPSPDAIAFLADLSNMGILSVLIAVLTGTVFTILIHSSGAATAIVITLALGRVINFEMAAGLVLGSNIGTTIDAFLASLGARTMAKRAAWIHVFFNVAGSIWAILLFKPFLALVVFLAGSGSIARQIAMLHTAFNLINAILFAPFIPGIVRLVSFLIKGKKEEETHALRLEYVAAPLLGSPELNLIMAQKEVANMADLCRKMFSQWKELLNNKPDSIEEELVQFKNMEEYADQMRDGLSVFLLECARHDMSSKRQEDLKVLLRMTVDLEDITDGCYNLILLLEKAREKNLELSPEELAELEPFTLLVENFLGFIKENINGPIDDAQLALASKLEDSIDDLRNSLRNEAQNRLQTGADVKSQLLFIDIVRRVERIGDHAYGVAHALRELH